MQVVCIRIFFVDIQQDISTVYLYKSTVVLYFTIAIKCLFKIVVITGIMIRTGTGNNLIKRSSDG